MSPDSTELPDEACNGHMIYLLLLKVLNCKDSTLVLPNDVCSIIRHQHACC
jgi:hypothetical protein